MRKSRSGKPRTKSAKAPTRPTPPEAPDGDPADVAGAAEDALQTLKELEELVVESGARPKARKRRRWWPFGGRSEEPAAARKTRSRRGSRANPGVEAAAEPGRERLIRDALAIQRDKQSVLAGLDDEQRALLHALAQKMLGAGDPGKDRP